MTLHHSSGDDGRYIDPQLGLLLGEGSHQISKGQPVHQLQSPYAPDGQPSYYNRPVLKPPVWIWSIPAYFYVGGVAGAGMALALAAQMFGGGRLPAFEERCRWIGAVGGGIGTAFLIHDLGRKERFLFMLRVFRPTSPMSIGSWVLAAATPLSAGSALLTFAAGPLYRLGQVAGIGAGVLGLPLATYTAVLISNTAVPVWQAGRRILPLLFAASAMAGLGSVLNLMRLDAHEHAVAEYFGTVGRVAELAAGVVLEHEVSRVPRVGKPLREGLTGTLWKAAKVATAASLVVSMMPGASRAKRIAAGLLGTAGAICLRFAVFYAGRNSALDPHATFQQQRTGGLRNLPPVAAPTQHSTSVPQPSGASVVT
jgi:formate-dependent nitrite reductase membrane component NrfD